MSSRCDMTDKEGQEAEEANHGSEWRVRETDAWLLTISNFGTEIHGVFFFFSFQVFFCFRVNETTPTSSILKTTSLLFSPLLFIYIYFSHWFHFCMNGWAFWLVCCCCSSHFIAHGPSLLQMLEECIFTVSPVPSFVSRLFILGKWPRVIVQMD